MTEDSWRAAAQGWSDHTPLIRPWLAAVTARMLDAAQLQPGHAVLDVAAGAGDQSMDIAARVGPKGRVLATDLSPAILTHARARLDAAGLAWVETRVADAQSLESEGAGFDACVSRLGLMFCQAPRLALHGMHAALRPGGIAAVVVFGELAHNPCIELTTRIAREHAGVPPTSLEEPGALLSLGRPGVLDALFSRAGFEGVQVQAVDAPFRAPSSAHYVQFVREAGSPLQRLLAALSPTAQATAWAAMTAALRRYEVGPHGEFVGPNRLLLGVGRRYSG